MKRRKITQEKAHAIDRKLAMREPFSTDATTMEGSPRLIRVDNRERRIDPDRAPWPTGKGGE